MSSHTFVNKRLIPVLKFTLDIVSFLALTHSNALFVYRFVDVFFNWNLILIVTTCFFHFLKAVTCNYASSVLAVRGRLLCVMEACYHVSYHDRNEFMIFDVGI